MATLISRTQLLALTLLLGIVSGCSVYSPTGSPAPISTSEPGESTPDSGIPSSPDANPPEPQAWETIPSSNSTDNSLVSRAEAALAAGDYELALSLLERAQRIDPTNADIYLAMVRTYSAKGDTRLARTTAERGLLYCRNDNQCNQLRAFTE